MSPISEVNQQGLKISNSLNRLIYFFQPEVIYAENLKNIPVHQKSNLHTFKGQLGKTDQMYHNTE